MFIDFKFIADRLVSSSDTVALRNLFIRRDDVGKDFCDNIRAYNSAFAFTSMGVKLDRDLANGKRFNQKKNTYLHIDF